MRSAAFVTGEENASEEASIRLIQASPVRHPRIMCVRAHLLRSPQHKVIVIERAILQAATRWRPIFLLQPVFRSDVFFDLASWPGPDHGADSAAASCRKGSEAHFRRHVPSRTFAVTASV
jgi:hypothetical protein